jgi:hypothetical protein
MEKLNDGEPNGIGTSRGPSREDAMGPIIDRGRTHQLKSLRPIKHPENEEVGETFDVGEASFELGKDFEDAICVVFGAETFRDLLGAFVGSFSVTDWLRSEHKVGASFEGRKRCVARVTCNDEFLMLFSCVTPRIRRYIPFKIFTRD